MEFLFISVLFLILFYFKNEYIFFSFLKLRKQDFIGTKKWLDRIKNPEKILVKKQIGYYHYLYGIIESQKNLTQAEKSFRSFILWIINEYGSGHGKTKSCRILIQKKKKKGEATILITEAKKIRQAQHVGRAN